MTELRRIFVGKAKDLRSYCAVTSLIKGVGGDMLLTDIGHHKIRGNKVLRIDPLACQSTSSTIDYNRIRQVWEVD